MENTANQMEPTANRLSQWFPLTSSVRYTQTGDNPLNQWLLIGALFPDCRDRDGFAHCFVNALTGELARNDGDGPDFYCNTAIDDKIGLRHTITKVRTEHDIVHLSSEFPGEVPDAIYHWHPTTGDVLFVRSNSAINTNKDTETERWQMLGTASAEVEGTENRYYFLNLLTGEIGTPSDGTSVFTADFIEYGTDVRIIFGDWNIPGGGN